MNINGLDYNTQREHLVLPEYGREIQSMVDFAVSLPDKAERQHCAEAIIGIMERMFPQNRSSEDYEQKLWDHLALMSGFKLDIDYPFDVSQAKQMARKPEPLAYPMSPIPVRHYGKMVFELFSKLKDMPLGPEKDELIRVTANQMKRNLVQWSHGSTDDEKVVSDIARYTGGQVQIDLDDFRFADINEKEVINRSRKKK